MTDSASFYLDYQFRHWPEYHLLNLAPNSSLNGESYSHLVLGVLFHNLYYIKFFKFDAADGIACRYKQKLCLQQWALLIIPNRLHWIKQLYSKFDCALPELRRHALSTGLGQEESRPM